MCQSSQETGRAGLPQPLMGRSAAPKAKLDVAWALGPAGGGEWPGALPAGFQQPGFLGRVDSEVGPCLVGGHFTALCLPQAQAHL